MGLAERFKNRLDNRDIFTKTNIENNSKNKILNLYPNQSLTKQIFNQKKYI